MPNDSDYYPSKNPFQNTNEATLRKKSVVELVSDQNPNRINNARCYAAALCHLLASAGESDRQHEQIDWLVAYLISMPNFPHEIATSVSTVVAEEASRASAYGDRLLKDTIQMIEKYPDGPCDVADATATLIHDMYRLAAVLQYPPKQRTFIRDLAEHVGIDFLDLDIIETLVEKEQKAMEDARKKKPAPSRAA